MDLLLFFAPTFVFTLASVYAVWRSRQHTNRVKIYFEKTVSDLQEYNRKMKAELHNKDVQIEQLTKDVKRAPSSDVLEMLHDLKAGGCMFRVEVLNPDAMFYWTPGGK